MLKAFNYERIYKNPVIKRGYEKIKECYRTLFESFIEHIARKKRNSPIFTEFLDHFASNYLEMNTPADMVRDFIAGMTDDYFLAQAAALGCQVPEKL
jgi:dGTPase